MATFPYVDITNDMALLKEDGSVDIEYNHKLSIEEFLEKCHAIHSLTEEQIEELAKRSKGKPLRATLPVKVDFSVEDLLAKGYGTIEDICKIILEE